MYMDKQNVSREEVEDFFGPSNFASESEEILEGATPVEIKSWSIEDFIVEAVHKNADKAIERARELASKPAVIFLTLKSVSSLLRVLKQLVKLSHSQKLLLRQWLHLSKWMKILSSIL